MQNAVSYVNITRDKQSKGFGYLKPSDIMRSRWFRSADTMNITVRAPIATHNQYGYV